MRSSTTVSPRAYKRRSARVQLKIQLSIEIGDDSVLDAETITVSKHGARIRITSTRGQLTNGERVRVKMRRGQQSQPGRVVWMDKRSDPHYGIELDDPGNFWGVSFPSKDNGEVHLQRRRNAAHPANKATDISATLAAIAELGTADKAPSSMPLADPRSISALVSGMSAIRLPFAERVDMVFTHAEEANALLRTTVEPGAVLRVTFGDNRTTKARVMAVGGQREAGKWSVRVRCDVASA
ncbi:MAG: PilZ domain-containing protein [Terriglobales bacterium]